MPNKSNVEMLDKIKASLEASQGFFVVDYRGLTVKEAQDIRRSLRDVNAEMKVYKNNIVRIALKEEGLPDIGEDLVGTCAYVFFEKDPVDAAKCIKEKGEKLKKLAFVAGVADGKGLNAEEAKAISQAARSSWLSSCTLWQARCVASLRSAPVPPVASLPCSTLLRSRRRRLHRQQSTSSRKRQLVSFERMSGRRCVPEPKELTWLSPRMRLSRHLRV